MGEGGGGTDREVRLSNRGLVTGLRAGARSSGRATRLDLGWELIETASGATADPSGLPSEGWSAADVPGTVASSHGGDDLDGHPDYDGSDWWYRIRIPRPEMQSAERAVIRLEGLATLAEVWFNGEQLLASANMFRGHSLDVTEAMRDENELIIAFRSLGVALGERRPRPKWKPNLVRQQGLRWFRTTLLGRIPGWTPAIPAVGPWRPVWLEIESLLDVRDLDVQTWTDEGSGFLEVSAEVAPLDGAIVESAVVSVGEVEYPLTVTSGATGEVRLSGVAEVVDPPLWWPHTHGTPTTVESRLLVRTDVGDVRVALGRVGFRDIAVDRTGGALRLVINGVPVFCRGSCWTTNDIVSLAGDPEELRRTLRLTAGAGANMVRVGGTMVYESDDFYDICDELGLMVWQDFMFANMDYPADYPDYRANVEAEVTEQLRRLQRHPCLAAYCGSSEVEQQAAMLGAAPDIWSNELFHRVLPELVDEFHEGVPYWSSTPTGGALPFHVGQGLAHYFGIGAYKRPLDDVRLAGVRFTPECLGFSNIPDADMVASMSPTGIVPPHHPDWKRGVPRDSGAGWDFEDIRDHYLERMYGVDPVELRASDPTGYLELSRGVTGEIMAETFAEWRGGDLGCGGALTWFLKDLRPGAGWGIIDSLNRPKAAYYHVRRAWAPRAIFLLDRGLDGLTVSVVNDRPETLDAHIDIEVIARGSVVTARARHDFVLEAHEQARFQADDLLGYFTDSTYSYRFGPPPLEAVCAQLVERDSGRAISQAVFRPDRTRVTRAHELSASLRVDGEGRLLLDLESSSLLYDVRVEVRDHRADDNHLCLIPGRPRTLFLERTAKSGRAFRGYVEAHNLEEVVRLTEPD